MSAAGTATPSPAAARRAAPAVPASIPLHDRDAERCAPKAARLARALRRGLPVPWGLVVPDEARAAALTAGLLVADADGTLHAPRARALLEALRIPAARPGRRVAVRSAFGDEDDRHRSHAGAYPTVLDVDAGDPDALASALARVWSAGPAADGAPGGGRDHAEPRPALRRDVLVQDMVPARAAGVAFCEPRFQDDVVNWTQGLAEGLVSGKVPGHQLAVEALGPLERPRRTAGPADAEAATQPAFAARLQTLLASVRRVFGRRGAWDVEWADDGTTCHLVQVRPVTRPTLRNEAFTLANHKEILPPMPSRLMTDVIAGAAAGLYAWYREFDRDLPSDRPFLEVFEGRPCINLSLLCDTVRTWGLPTTLVTESIGGPAARSEVRAMRPLRLLRKLPVLARLGLAQQRCGAAARRARRAIAELARPLAADGGTDFAETLERFRRIYIELVQAMFALTAAISGPLAILRNLGVLAAHGRRHRTVSSRAYEELDALRRLAHARPERLDAVRDGRVPDDEEFARAWQAWLDEHGHRGVYESDVSRPRYAERPGLLLKSLAAAGPATRPGPVAGDPWLLRLVTLPVWIQARTAIDAREELRHDAMRAFGAVRRRLLELGREATAAGTLPEPEAVFDLDVDELVALGSGARRWSAQDLEARRAQLADMATVRLPDLFHRFDDLRATAEPPGTGASGALRGLGLGTGTASGPTFRADDAEAAAAGIPDGHVLVAPAIDAGWIPAILRASGVVVETGGELSHGSIVLRELGIPAVTNVTGAWDRLPTGTTITLDARTGRITTGAD